MITAENSSLLDKLMLSKYSTRFQQNMAIFLKEHAPVDQKSMLVLANKYEMAHKFVGYEKARPISTQGGMSKSSNIPMSGNLQRIRPLPFTIKCYI